MSKYLEWHDIVGDQTGDQKYLALAFVLYPYADKETGRLPGSAKGLMRNIFGDRNWGRINHSVDNMRIRGWLRNDMPRGKVGEWYLQLPEGIELSVVPNPALFPAVQDLVRRFGKDKIPDIIKLLEAFSAT